MVTPDFKKFQLFPLDALIAIDSNVLISFQQLTPRRKTERECTAVIWLKLNSEMLINEHLSGQFVRDEDHQFSLLL